MRSESPFGVHTLLRLTPDCQMEHDGARPEWLDVHPQWTRWAVVRRAFARPGWCAVGFRGTLRAQRWAALIAVAAVEHVVAPGELAGGLALADLQRRKHIPAIAIFPRVAQALAAHLPGVAWGPTGSVGLELASGMPWATPNSDLDLAVRADSPIDVQVARALHEALAHLPARVDVLVETSLGAVSLADLALRPGPWLLRTSDGPRLTKCLWPTSACIHAA